MRRWSWSSGTGALKVTPGHDPVDYEIGQRHNLEIVNVLNLDGTLNENAAEYAGLDVNDARRQVVARLESDGILESVDEFTHAVGHCDRCDEVVEPIVSDQWYVRMKPLAEPARAAVADGDIAIVPERFSRVYLNWMDNIRDWPISRQLWVGTPHTRLVLRIRLPNRGDGRPDRVRRVRLDQPRTRP